MLLTSTSKTHPDRGNVRFLPVLSGFSLVLVGKFLILTEIHVRLEREDGFEQPRYMSRMCWLESRMKLLGIVVEMESGV